MLRSNLHTHSVFCDGKNTVEEMVQAALEREFVSLGFSGHSPVEGDDSGMEDIPGYMAEIARCQEVYRNKITLYTGIEMDWLTEPLPYQFDYVIGSVHCLVKDGVQYPVDYSRSNFEESLAKGFGGDALAFAKLYYQTEDEMLSVMKPDIVGHFDLIRKFNADGSFFDEDDPVYRRMAEEVLRAHAKEAIFEINTGAIFRGYQTRPYPELWMLKVLRECGARITITSDAHNAVAIDGSFAQAKLLAEAAGFRTLWQLSPEGEGLKEYPL